MFLVKENAKLERERSCFCPRLFREETGPNQDRGGLRGAVVLDVVSWLALLVVLVVVLVDVVSDFCLFRNILGTVGRL